MKIPRLSDVPIRLKLTALLLVLVLVPFVLYTTIVVDQVSQQMDTLGFRTADLVLDQSARFVESRVDLVKRALDLLSLDSTIRELAVADPQPYLNDIGLWIRDAARIGQIENFFGQNNPDIRNLVLYMEGGIGASSSKDISRQFKYWGDQKDQQWYPLLDPAENTAIWISSHVDFQDSFPGDLHVLRRIPDDQNLLVNAGFARADVKVRGFEDILDKAQFSPETAAFLIDVRGDLIAVSSAARKHGDEVLSLLAQSPGGEWAAVHAAGTDFQVGTRPIPVAGWWLVMAIPHRDIGAFSDRVRTLLAFLLVIILPFMIPLSLWAASSSTRRLDQLLSGVRRLGDGGLDTELREVGSDEIGELTRSFNGMVVRIKGLVEDQYRLGTEVKNLELQALQAQINPHFLYNTLDLINGLALGAGQARIAETTLALSKFYRLTLSGGAETLPLEKEFDHAATYVRIQNLRFGDAVHLVVELNEPLKSFPIIKMILQPLVENAILHGILEKPKEQGTIALRGYAEGPWLCLEVEDDGVGMDAAVLERVLSPAHASASRSEHGYGLFNIDRRLRLRYGDDSGLIFESRPGHGTKVRVKIPYPNIN